MLHISQGPLGRFNIETFGKEYRLKYVVCECHILRRLPVLHDAALPHSMLDKINNRENDYYQYIWASVILINGQCIGYMLADHSIMNRNR